MESTVRVYAPAKLNLVLKICGREASGLHRLQSLMVPISLLDSVDVRKTPGEGNIRISCSLSNELSATFLRESELQNFVSELEGPTNLAYQAAKDFLCDNSISNVDLYLTLFKAIPAQAGLGGGSADAAATLVALAKLFADADPRSVAKSLGSDVFPQLSLGRPENSGFLGSEACLVTGTGRRVFELARSGGKKTGLNLSEITLLLIKPNLGVSTAEAYKELDVARGWLGGEGECAKEEPIAAEIYSLIEGLGLSPVVAGESSREMLTFPLPEGTSALPEICVSDDSFRSSWSKCFVNDFQDIVVAKSHELKNSQELLLQAGALNVLLAGSGSASVGFFMGEEQAEAALRFLKVHAPRSWFITKCGFLVGR